MDKLALIFGALAHDLGHPGVNNTFLITIQSETAVKCNIFMKDNDQSIQENFHLSMFYENLRNNKNNIFLHLDEV